ncbi:MAG: purine-cytosine permease family protein [Nocardioidaceae bacterium]
MASLIHSSDDTTVGNDDFALRRVPVHARYSWVTVAVQRFGQLSALAQFFLAASIGIGMTFWDAMLAILIGSVLLEVVTIFLGVAGMREGMSTSMLARWSGFGLKGSALVGSTIAISLVGWFAVQNEVFAVGMHTILPGIPLWLLCFAGGTAVTLIVVYGFASMSWVAYVTVPAFLALATWSVVTELDDHSLSSLVSSAPPGEAISLATATTIVAGGFIAGAIFTPDMSRYNRSVADVVKQTVVGVTFGEFFVGVIGVLLAHAIKISATADAGLVIGIIQSTSGTVGVLILAASILKINDWNLYPSSLGIANAVHGLFGLRANRAYIAILLGVLGSILSAFEFASRFQDFLTELGILFPPIAGIMIADYFVLRTWRTELDESRADGRLPAQVPDWVPAGLFAWALAYAFGKYSSENPDFLHAINVPALTSLVVAFVAYVLLGKIGFARGVRIRDVRTD